MSPRTNKTITSPIDLEIRVKPGGLRFGTAGFHVNEVVDDRAFVV
jgi:hypothetical protein